MSGERLGSSDTSAMAARARRPMAEITCFRCGKRGHIQAHCREPVPAPAAAATTLMAVSSPPVVGELTQHYAMDFFRPFFPALTVDFGPIEEFAISTTLFPAVSEIVPASNSTGVTVNLANLDTSCREKREPTVVSATAEFFLAVTRFDMDFFRPFFPALTVDFGPIEEFAISTTLFPAVSEIVLASNSTSFGPWIELLYCKVLCDAHFNFNDMLYSIAHASTLTQDYSEEREYTDKMENINIIDVVLRFKLEVRTNRLSPSSRSSLLLVRWGDGALQKAVGPLREPTVWWGRPSSLFFDLPVIPYLVDYGNPSEASILSALTFSMIGCCRIICASTVEMENQIDDTDESVFTAKALLNMNLYTPEPAKFDLPHCMVTGTKIMVLSLSQNSHWQAEG
ncbi:hypothetical protein F5878DRAFT_683321 [Lentinula raphanica]|uniref:CCHC-type domain-containing protein n=1 Tax=Lentinula raphanica TaxID=153919 RepID=A0AA38P8B2_9AGAR|nr:hypothetical protein F5878DRAFT_683321 [Lentinula raphanica]